jgi:hypothetical protein
MISRRIGKAEDGIIFVIFYRPKTDNAATALFHAPVQVLPLVVWSKLKLSATPWGAAEASAKRT